MKKNTKSILAIIMAAIMICTIFVACSKSNQGNDGNAVNNTVKESVENNTQESDIAEGNTEDISKSTNEVTADATENASKSNEQGSSNQAVTDKKQNSTATTNKKDTTTAKKQENTTNKKVETTTQKKSTPTTTKKAAQTTTKKATQTTKKPVTTTKKQTTTKKNATAADVQQVANKVVQYINSYRSTNATKLPGLTKYAQYRSKQLVSNFAHDAKDITAASNALKYGDYYSKEFLEECGVKNTTPYYSCRAAEAIGKVGGGGTVDEIAKDIATGFKNSPGHWRYVGASENKYIGVGVTYSGGYWYCCVSIADYNTDTNSQKY